MRSMMRSSLILLSLLLLWELLTIISQLPSYILPSPQQVACALYQQRYLIAIHALPTIIETILGFVLGVLFSCSAALFLTFFQSLSRWLMPILIMSQAMPTFAMAPLLVIWLGYGFKTKIVTTILMLFFPITSAFYDGLRQTNQDWLDLAQIMQASPWRILWYIRLPAALPKLASGMRIAAAAAPMGAIISEWVGASRGLGYLMLSANAHMQIDLVFATLFVIIFLSLALYFAIDQLTQAWVWW